MLKGASGSAAEVWFHLAQASDPSTPILAHPFLAGEVMQWLPNTGAFGASTVGHIVEKDFGDYAVQLTAPETAQDGPVYLFVNVSGSQPFRTFENIVDPASPAIYELPFALQLRTDPIFGDGTGVVFALGDVKYRFSADLAYSDVLVPQIVERGHNIYAARLTGAQRLAVNKASVYANPASGLFLPFSADYDMVLSTMLGSVPAGPVVPVTSPPFIAPTIGPIDHIAGALSRLVAQLRSGVQ